MKRKTYPSDLTDREWQSIKNLISPAKRGGRPREVNMRQVLNAIFYLLRGGIAWRMLPKDFPPRGTVYHYFRLFRLDGTWERIHDHLRRQVRIREGRKPPSICRDT